MFYFGFFYRCLTNETRVPFTYICTHYDEDDDWFIAGDTKTYTIPSGASQLVIGYVSHLKEPVRFCFILINLVSFYISNVLEDTIEKGLEDNAIVYGNKQSNTVI